jgi:hypothetical protein
MMYFGVWNDMYFTDDPEVRYSECFQGDGIVVWAGVVVKIVEREGLGGGLVESGVCAGVCVPEWNR